MSPNTRARCTGRAVVRVPLKRCREILARIPRHVRILGAELTPVGLLVDFDYGPVWGGRPSDVRRALERAADGADVGIPLFERHVIETRSA